MTMTKYDIRDWQADEVTQHYISALRKAIDTTMERLINIDHSKPESLATVYAYQKGFLAGLAFAEETINDLLTEKSGDDRDDEEV
jgi:hypothetical protein